MAINVGRLLGKILGPSLGASEITFDCLLPLLVFADFVFSPMLDFSHDLSDFDACPFMH